MNRRALIKRLFLATLIYILGAGIVLANSCCLLGCYGHRKSSQSSHHGSAPRGHDTPLDCSSDLKVSPCHHISNFNLAIHNVDRSTQFVEKNLTSNNFATVVAGGFSASCSNQYFADPVKLQTKAPDVPLFLRNLSLLF